MLPVTLPPPIVIGAPAPRLGHAPVPAWAPNEPAGTWPAAALPVTFVLALPASRDVGAGAAAELEVALRTWGRAPCTAFRARLGGERALAPGDDGVNGVFFDDEAWPPELVPGAVAQTVVHVDEDGAIHDADIHLNGHDFRFSLDGAEGTLDLRSVLVHELGHALGLGHSSDPRATMYATGSGLRWRSLERDDVVGVCALYPGAGAAGCDATPCPAPFVCVAGACQRPGERDDVCSPCARVPGACEAAGDEARCVDIGEGATAGRVCGRACATSAECGAGFRCEATTASGDLQCVSLDGCRNGASPCATDADCAGALCRAGACVGAPGDAGADAGPEPDAGPDAGAEPTAPPGGCGCVAAGQRRAPLGGLAVTLLVLLALTRSWSRTLAPTRS